MRARSGAGGFLQGPMFGYTRLTINDTAVALDPLLFDGATSAMIRGYSYRGNRLDIAYTAANISVTLQPAAADDPARRGDGAVLHVLPAAQQWRHTYIAGGTTRAGLVDHSTALLPPHAAVDRSQRGQVVLGGGSSRIAATPLVLVDASGAQHVLAVGQTVTVPLQAVAIVPAP